MADVKDLRVAFISRQAAADLVKAVHYSHSTVNNSQLNLGVFLGTRLEGAMMFGPPLDRRKLLTLVEGTPWNGMLELNRMAFSEQLPRNSESRAIAVAMRMIRRNYPHIEWIVSFADATRCGDGTIYRATGFLLTGIKKNATIWSNGEALITNVGVRTSQKKIQHFAHGSEAGYKGSGSMDHYKAQGFKPLPGFQLRYLYFVNPDARARLTVPVIPYSEIQARGAAMYKGQTRVGSIPVETAVLHTEEGGSTPTPTLHTTMSTSR